MQFSNFAGNQQVIQALSSAVEEDRLPHAIILEGPEGCGKRTLAGILAAAAVCSGTPKPCGACSHCVKAQAGSHPDIFVASGGTAARSFHVETIRFLRSDAYIRPNEASHKVYLLFRAESMSEQAQNALLKILEEPPPHVIFILTCVSASALLSTIRSRARIFSLAPPSPEEALRVLRGKLPDVSEESLCAAVEEWGGNIGRILDSVGNSRAQEAAELAPQILQAAILREEFPLLRLAAPLIRDKDLFRAVLERLSNLVRDACVIRAGGKALFPHAAVEEFSAALTRERLMAVSSLVAQTRNSLERNANAALLVTTLCASLRSAVGR